VTPAALRNRRDDLVRKAPAAKSPLGRDLLGGRPTERSFLTDGLIAAARKKKVPTPLLSSLDRLLRRLEKEGAAS
jgi:ketopantoate reductase